MSPFQDLAQRCGASLPAESVPNLPSSGSAPVGGSPDTNAELRVISLPQFVRLLSLGVLVLVGLLSLGIGGVVLVQGHLFRASEVGPRDLMGPSRRGETSSPRANARRESGASARTPAGNPSEALRKGARPQRRVAQSAPAPRRPVSISRSQPETLEAAHVETTTAP